MDMSSDLEFMIETDMIEHGYNPYDPSEVEAYWKERLNGN